MTATVSLELLQSLVQQVLTNQERFEGEMRRVNGRLTRIDRRLTRLEAALAKGIDTEADRQGQIDELVERVERLEHPQTPG
jgi:predicted nuclease with TOPRIM domain